jgi:HEPN domain-containing protein
MNKLPLGSILGAVVRIAVTGTGVTGEKGRVHFVRRQYVELVETAQAARKNAIDLDLPASLAACDRILEILARAKHDKPDLAYLDQMDTGLLGTACGSLATAFRDETMGRFALVLPLSAWKLYEQQDPLFGDEVFINFHSANEDIAEAGMCLALGRATACVMHLNRAMEVALKALANTVGVGQQNDWGAYIREIERELRARLAAVGRRTPDEQFYSEAVAEFDHVRRAWRNPTMHPEKSYSTERAEEIFAAVRSFMRHLATRISE